MKPEFEVKPHINGDWKVIHNQRIDVTCKDSSVRPEYLIHPELSFIGSMEECQKYAKSRIDSLLTTIQK